MYTALYREWRPDTFRDVVGQDTIVRTLKNQLSSGRIAHAYLFCGSRGTGKTSTAKIFSRAINCMSPTEDGPCGKCEACIHLSSENNMDIMEMDAASNNGVDEIRDLRDKIRFPPTVGKYKVYIIDEVHMLSTGAFNALLKTLEEPPAHVVFILATTEPQKLPATVLSRCQRFDFKRIPRGTIANRLKTICDRMDVTVEESGLQVIARWAEGGMRDALSLLDQCMGFCGKNISKEDVLNVLGTEDQSFLFQAADDILAGHAEGLLCRIDRLIDDGKDLNVFLKDMLQHLRDLLIVKFCEDPAQLLDVEDSTMEQLKEQAEKAGEARLIRSVDLLSSLESEMRWSSQPRVLFELAAIKLCRPRQEDSMEALIDRIEELERRLGENGSIPANLPPAVVSDGEKSSSPDAESPAGVSLGSAESGADGILNAEGREEPDTEERQRPDTERQKAPDAHERRKPDTVPGSAEPGDPHSERTEREDVQRTVRSAEPADSDSSKSPDTKLPADSPNTKLRETKSPDDPRGNRSGGSVTDGSRDPVRAWPDILEEIREERIAIYPLLTDARPRMDGDHVLVLVFPPSSGFFVAAVEKEENKAFVEEQVQKVTGRKVRLRCRLEEEEEEQAAALDDDIVGKAVKIFGKDLVKVIDGDKAEEREE